MELGIRGEHSVEVFFKIDSGRDTLLLIIIVSIKLDKFYRTKQVLPHFLMIKNTALRNI